MPYDAIKAGPKPPLLATDATAPTPESLASVMMGHDEWHANTSPQDGTWWTEWAAWLTKHGAANRHNFSLSGPAQAWARYRFDLALPCNRRPSRQPVAPCTGADCAGLRLMAGSSIWIEETSDCSCSGFGMSRRA